MIRRDIYWGLFWGPLLFENFRLSFFGGAYKGDVGIHEVHGSRALFRTWA